MLCYVIDMKPWFSHDSDSFQGPTSNVCLSDKSVVVINQQKQTTPMFLFGYKMSFLQIVWEGVATYVTFIMCNWISK